MSASPVTDFGAAMAAAGLGAPETIIADGNIQRFRAADDKPGTRNGWYVLHVDGTPAGAFGSWRAGITETWSAAGDDATEADRRAMRRLMERARQQREAERRDAHAAAAAKAKHMLEQAAPADPDHPYLARKAISTHGIRQLGRALLIPVYADGELSSVQSIQPDGNKRFLSGGRTSGGCYLLNDGTRRPELLICEGFATAATLHEETGAAVWCAFNAGNLLHVARAVRRQRPQGEVIVCGDDDRWTEGNPGAAKARAAALDIGAKLLLPDWTGLDLSGHPTDFNDCYRLRRAAAGRAAA
ncbi:toprim domain-containing protein [uncultured Thiohalocapsa sp.]|uniref:toprim domain-containing protein n=1 Tax=uncultured Thiohalocapsa sp. TaxID=768990 RepID=UPI0025E41318|nr:toprim domain-containing protein [uncultured Thiohalocapsa sp.]